MSAETLRNWHHLVASKDLSGLDALLADNVVFHSPVVHTPQEGKAITTMYLTGAFHILLANDFRYLREVMGERDAMLEFHAVIDGISINGIDMMHFDDEGRIDDFKVMVRPLKAINLLHRKMGEMLASMKTQPTQDDAD